MMTLFEPRNGLLNLLSRQRRSSLLLQNNHDFCQQYGSSVDLHEAPCHSKSSYDAIQNCHAIAHVE